MSGPTPSPESHLSGVCAPWLARFALGAGFAAASTVVAAESDAWQRVVEQTMAETCAIRNLPLKRPVAVRSMSRFQGGYTEGIGSTVWEAEFADAWRDGWCALGVYCAPKGRTGTGQGGATSNQPGLYDVAENALYIDTAADARSTVAHEFVHALQHQNFPDMNALHLWYNRDLAAAGNTVIEGGAHVVGWSFSSQERVRLCLMTPEPGESRRPRWWDWEPNAFKAHEVFPHAFGPEIALANLLDEGTDGLDALLTDPPLSTLAVLEPAAAGPVDFIKLPVDALAGALSERNCEMGLRNTAGAVGIWGLLRQHGDADAARAEIPAFVTDWAGDRFVHYRCADEDDELAWLSRWRTTEAALEFATRIRKVAASMVEYGGVLGAEPAVVVRNQAVIVLTPGLEGLLDSVAEAETRTFSRYRGWIASGCFPQDTCYNPLNETESTSTGDPPAMCTESVRRGRSAPPPSGFVAWLERVRQARNEPAPLIAGAAELSEVAGRLAVFCTRNAARNTDQKTACRAAYGGVSYLLRLDAEPDWRLLTRCIDDTELRHWLEDAYFADSPRAFASSAVVPATYGPVLAAQAFDADPVAGLSGLLDAPPMSSLQVLRPDLSAAIELIGLPRAELAARGCHVDAADSEGVLGIWNLAMDSDVAVEEDNMPSYLLDWRGDRQAFLRCKDDDRSSSGRVWIGRWRSPEAAASFARTYRALAPAAFEETGLDASAEVHVEEGTVWIVPPALAELTPLLREETEFRSYADFRDWVADGCFPQSSCN